MLEIMQGDQYILPMRVKIDGETLRGDNVDRMEVSIGAVQKSSPGEVEFDGARWLVPLTQEDTFKLHPGDNQCHIRVTTKTGDTVDEETGTVAVLKSFSKEVL